MSPTAPDAPSRSLIGLAILIGLATIAAAWGYQIIGGYVPCKLCYQERIPYYVGLPLLAVALVLARSRPASARLAAGLGAVVFLLGFGLGSFHAGAEWGFWPGPSDCGGGVGPVTDAGSLLAQMKSTRLVSCTEATWRLFGLSFAGWNAVLSLAVAGLALAGAAVRRRPQPLNPPAAR